MHLYQRGSYWWFEFEYGGTRYRESTGERDKRRAQGVARKRRAQVQAGEPSWRNRLREARLVDLLARESAEAETKRLAQGYRNALATYHHHLVEFFGRDATLAAVTYDTVREYEDWRREPKQLTLKSKRRRGQVVTRPGARGQSIREEVACLKRAFKRAMRMKLIRVGLEEWPEIRSDKPDKRRKGKSVPLEHLGAILAELDQEVREEITFEALTGLRREELPEVRWSWIRKDRGAAAEMHVPIESRKAGDEYVVPLPADAYEAAAARRMRQAPEEKLADAPLFPKHDWRKRIRSACKRAGAPWFTYRDLRATYGNLMERKGGMIVARDSLGHDDVDTTNIYMRATLEERRKAAEAAQAALRAAVRAAGRKQDRRR